MKLTAIALALLTVACTPDEPRTETAERKKTVAEEAFDAGQSARKKAEDIKAEQEKKAKEAIEETDQ